VMLSCTKKISTVFVEIDLNREFFATSWYIENINNCIYSDVIGHSNGQQNILNK